MSKLEKEICQTSKEEIVFGLLFNIKGDSFGSDHLLCGYTDERSSYFFSHNYFWFVAKLECLVQAAN